jgi:hypothetical protein
MVATMAVQVGTKLSVQGFGYVGDDTSKRLVGPSVEGHGLTGRAGSLQYGVADLLLDKVEGRLDITRWGADAASLGGAWLRDDSGRLDVAVERVEMPNGMVIARAAKGVEILSPHFALSEVKLTVLNPPGTEVPVPARKGPPAPPAGLRQDQLRFLDSLAGHVDLTIKVSLHLPVLGTRSLDQALALKIEDGSLDYRGLEEQLDWLEGRFLDIKHTGDKLALTWRVPIFGSKHELITWALDTEAATLAAFGRVPVRSLADYRLAARDKDDDANDRDKKKKPAGAGAGAGDDDDDDGLLRAFALEGVDIALSLLAPRNLAVGGGTIAFGGDGQPGMVDLKVTGGLANAGPGALHGSIGGLDTTIKDLKLGGVVMSADRLSIDGIEALEVEFDGFRPVKATMVIHRVTATNLVVQIGSGA